MDLRLKMPILKSKIGQKWKLHKIAQNWKTEIKIGQIERSDRIKKKDNNENGTRLRQKSDKIKQSWRLLDKDEKLGEIEKWIKKINRDKSWQNCLKLNIR